MKWHVSIVNTHVNSSLFNSTTQNLLKALYGNSVPHHQQKNGGTEQLIFKKKEETNKNVTTI